MKRFAFSVVVTAVLGLAAYSLAGAQGIRYGFHGSDARPAGFFQERLGRGGPWGGRGRGGGPMFALRGLDLTDDQKEKIKAIHEAERENRQAPPADVDLHRQLRAELYADSPDAGKIATLQDQLAQAQTARLTRQIGIEQKIAEVLTAEQRAQVRERLSTAPRAPARNRQGAER